MDPAVEVLMKGFDALTEDLKRSFTEELSKRAEAASSAPNMVEGGEVALTGVLEEGAPNIVEGGEVALEGVLEEGAPNIVEGGEAAVEGIPEEGGGNPLRNGYSRIIGAAVVGGVIGYVAVPLVVTFGLYYAGFAATGIVSGSFAAASQAAVGNVTAGSWIATCTSLGMTGAAATTTPGAAASAVTLAGVTFLTNKNDGDNQV